MLPSSTGVIVDGSPEDVRKVNEQIALMLRKPWVIGWRCQLK